MYDKITSNKSLPIIMFASQVGSRYCVSKYFGKNEMELAMENKENDSAKTMPT